MPYKYEPPTEYMDLAEYLEKYGKKIPEPSPKRSKRRKKGPSAGELKLASDIKLAGLPEPKLEHIFHETRKWRFDFAWPQWNLAAEVNGGTWSNGRHNRGSAISAEYEKLNNAVLCGWLVFLFTTEMVQDGTAVQHLLEFFGDENG